MAGNPDEWPEIVYPAAFDGVLPATVPVRGPDGELIDGAVADLHEDADGIVATVRIPGPPAP